MKPNKKESLAYAETIEALHRVFNRQHNKVERSRDGALTWLTWCEESPTLELALQRCKRIQSKLIPKVVTVRPHEALAKRRVFDIVVCISRSAK